MELHREEQKASDAKVERKPKRFRIVKLEERIAPDQGGAGTNNCPVSGSCFVCGCTYGCHHHGGTLT